MTIGSGPISGAAISAEGGGPIVVVPTVSGQINEVFVVDDAATGTLVIPGSISEVFTVGDSVWVGTTTSEIVQEVFFVQDTPVPSQFSTLREVFVATETSAPRSIIRRVVRDDVVAVARVTGFATSSQTVQETAVATGIVQPPTIGAALHEVFDAQDTPQPALTTRRTVREVLQALGRARPRQGSTLRESFTTSSRITISNYRNVIYREVAQARGEALAPVTNLRVVVREVLVALGRAVPRSALRETAVERLFATDYAYAPLSDEALADFEADVPLAETQAFTADMAGWGMSRYVRMPVEDFVGTQFGVGPTGLFTYDSTPVLGFVETGDTMLRAGDNPLPERKRFNYLYVYGRSSDKMSCRVTADVASQRESHTYTDPWRSGDDSRAMRFQLGRGFSGTFVKLRVGGAVNFDVHAMELETTVTSRRV